MKRREFIVALGRRGGMAAGSAAQQSAFDVAVGFPKRPLARHPTRFGGGVPSRAS